MNIGRAIIMMMAGVFVVFGVVLMITSLMAGRYELAAVNVMLIAANSAIIFAVTKIRSRT